MKPGTLLAIPLPDGRFGAAQVLGGDEKICEITIFGVIFECAPAGALDFEDALVAVDHIAVPIARLAEAVAVGHRPAVHEGHALWQQAGRPVVDAPLAALVMALVDG